MKHLPTVISRSFLVSVLTINLCTFFYLMGYLKINHDLFQDTAFSVWVQSYRTPEFTLFMKFISLWGNLYVGVLSVSLLALYLYRHKKVNSAILILCTLFASLLGSLLKWWVDRPRPTGKELEMVTNLQDQSFPSNHAIHYTVFFGLIMYFIERKIIKLKPLPALIIRLSCFILIILVGLSRIYLGAHYLTDVIGGYLLGSLFLIGAILLIHQLKIKP